MLHPVRDVTPGEECSQALPVFAWRATGRAAQCHPDLAKSSRLEQYAQAARCYEALRQQALRLLDEITLRNRPGAERFGSQKRETTKKRRSPVPGKPALPRHFE